MFTCRCRSLFPGHLISILRSVMSKFWITLDRKNLNSSPSPPPSRQMPSNQQLQVKGQLYKNVTFNVMLAKEEVVVLHHAHLYQIQF
jgi:hypothetical protein